MENIMSAAIKPTKSEPGAGRGPRAGSPRGAEVATGSKTQPQIETSNQDTRFPNSRRIYVDGKQPGVRVPFREVDQNPTRNFDNTLEENLPVRVYDSSGPWGDPAIVCDVRDGLPLKRREWII